MSRARVRAQAKINVWLHVLGPRADGFHEISSLFQRLELADDVLIAVSEDDDRRLVEAAGPRMPDGGLGPMESNLAYRAASAFAERTGFPRGFDIRITKNIPVGGGLGGGSADAGAVLRALNALAPAPLDASQLRHLAAGIGSDVAFLSTEFPSALATGRGEILVPATREMPVADVLLAVPAFGISTADAYGWLRESRAYDRSSASRPLAMVVPKTRPWAAQDQGNTFERVVEPRFPVLRDIRERLAASGASIARLSGSGSTVFGLYDGHAVAPDARDLAIDALVIRTRTAANVVPVTVLE